MTEIRQFKCPRLLLRHFPSDQCLLVSTFTLKLVGLGDVGLRCLDQVIRDEIWMQNSEQVALDLRFALLLSARNSRMFLLLVKRKVLF